MKIDIGFLVVFLATVGMLSLPYSRAKWIILGTIGIIVWVGLFVLNCIAWWLSVALSFNSLFTSIFLSFQIVTSYCFFTKTLIFERLRHSK